MAIAKRERDPAENDSEEEAQTIAPRDLPPWVVCQNTWALWRKGLKPPPWLQLSNAFVQQVDVIRQWGELAAEDLEEPRSKAVSVKPVPVALAPHAAAPAFDPAVLSRVARIKSVESVSPASVLQPL